RPPARLDDLQGLLDGVLVELGQPAVDADPVGRPVGLLEGPVGLRVGYVLHTHDDVHGRVLDLQCVGSGGGRKGDGGSSARLCYPLVMRGQGALRQTVAAVPRPGQRPSKVALPGPCSTKDDMPRVRSFVANSAANWIRSISRPVSRSTSSPRSTASLAARNAYAGPPTYRSTRRRAAAYTSPGGVTSSTSPMASASAASTKRPEKMRSFARAGPTRRG